METKQTNFNSWKKDKAWSDKFIPQIKRVLGELFISESPEETDRDEATDLIVLEIRPFRIACRIRKAEFFDRYPNEFTIRSSRPSGQKTEIKKIIAGWGDYYFYGFSNHMENDLLSYVVLDLNVFREHISLHQEKKHLQFSRHKNMDNSSGFIAYALSSFPDDFIIKRVLPHG